MALSSIPLLVIFCVLGVGVLYSYYAAVGGATPEEAEKLFAGVQVRAEQMTVTQRASVRSKRFSQHSIPQL